MYTDTLVDMASSKYLVAEDSGLPKWQIALAVGGAAVVCVGVYYKFFKNSKAKSGKKSSKSTASKNGKAAYIPEADVSK